MIVFYNFLFCEPINTSVPFMKGVPERELPMKVEEASNLLNKRIEDMK